MSPGFHFTFLYFMTPPNTRTFYIDEEHVTGRPGECPLIFQSKFVTSTITLSPQMFIPTHLYRLFVPAGSHNKYVSFTPCMNWLSF